MEQGSVREESMETLHILLVEDDAMMRHAVRRALHSLGENVRIHEEEDGESAICLLKSAEFDCVFLDYQLRGTDGLEVLRRVREKGVKTPIIILTAKGDEQLAVEMMKAGASDYVPKLNMTPERLNQSLRAALRLSHAEKRAAEAAQRYRLLFEDAPYGVLIVDPDDQRIVESNSAIQKQLGYSGEELAVKQIWELEVGVTREQIQAHMERNLVRDRDEFETRFRTKSGEIRDVLIVVRPLHQPGKIYLQGIFQDITERNRLKEQLLQSQKMEAIGRLAGGIAHDFNNLLAIISGYAESLTRRLGDENLRSHASEIQNAAERGGALTRQLLAFGRRQVVRPELLNLNKCITGMNEILRRLLSRETYIAINPDPKLPDIEADLGQMEQVILNLALNARDAMAGAGTLTIATSSREFDENEASMHGLRAGEYVLLSVADTGRGIDPEVRPHIFEPFFTTKEGKGSGLGLSIVYGIVQQAGGNVMVESEVGKGARFDVYLPSLAKSARTRDQGASNAQ
jgi:two-component system cell cycle sensor histidine kinase/response regulator CckA